MDMKCSSWRRGCRRGGVEERDVDEHLDEVFKTMEDTTTSGRSSEEEEILSKNIKKEKEKKYMYLPWMPPWLIGLPVIQAELLRLP